MRKFIIFFASFSIFLAIGSLLAALLQCPKCGYEYKDGAAVCTHCGKELSATSSAAAPSAPVKPVISRQILAAEIAAVDKAEDEDRSTLTLLRARNTLALLKLSSDANAARPAELIRAIGEAETGIRESLDECFACRGTGRKIYLMADLRGNLSKQSAASGTVGCPICNGRGTIKSLTSSARITARMASARQRYDRSQQARGWEEYSGIWMPPGILATLDIRQKTALKTAAASVCGTCYGFGSFGCPTCKGEGMLKCSNTKCVQGQETCVACKGKRKVADPTSKSGVERTCTACGGTGVSVCSICAGRASLPCVKCESTGRAQCTICKGSGEPPDCTKCDGTGLAPCKTCKGTGEVKGAVCSTCQGEKEAPCSSCTGTGHAKR